MRLGKINYFQLLGRFCILIDLLMLFKGRIFTEGHDITNFSIKVFSVNFMFSNQSNWWLAWPLFMTQITSLGRESGSLKSALLICLRGTRGWICRQRGEGQGALSTCSSVDKALFLLLEVTSVHLPADLKPLVNSILSISWVEADNNADTDKTGLQLCAWTTSQQGLYWDQHTHSTRDLIISQTAPLRIWIY